MAQQMTKDTPETADAKTGNIKVARLLVRALWQVEWMQANPASTGADRNEAWKAVRDTRLEHLKTARKVVNLLDKWGVTMTPPANPDETGEND